MEDSTITAPTGRGINERHSRRVALRRFGGGIAAIGAAAPALARAEGWTGTPPKAPGDAPDIALAFDLEGSKPQEFAGGTLRTLTSAEMKFLDGISFYSEHINPGGLRELHWHMNANELSYVLAGQGEIGIFSTDGTGTTFAIRPDSVTFVPNGYTHYIRNSGSDPLHILIAFSDAAPEQINLSQALPAVPQHLLAGTFGLGSAEFPFLPAIGNQVIVPMTGANLPATTESANPFSVHVDNIAAKTYLGGTVKEIGTKDIASLEGITVFPLRIDPFGQRESHWHPNASELNYCVSGTAQIGIVAPDGSVQTFVVGPGSAAFIPLNWFHYIANVSDEPLDLLIFFGNVKPNHIDLSQTFDYFPPEILAASFGLDPALLADLPKRGDVFIAAPPSGE